MFVHEAEIIESVFIGAVSIIVSVSHESSGIQLPTTAVETGSICTVVAHVFVIHRVTGSVHVTKLVDAVLTAVVHTATVIFCAINIYKKSI